MSYYFILFKIILLQRMAWYCGLACLYHYFLKNMLFLLLPMATLIKYKQKKVVEREAKNTLKVSRNLPINFYRLIVFEIYSLKHQPLQHFKLVYRYSRYRYLYIIHPN